MHGRGYLLDALLECRGRFAECVPPRWLWEWVPGMYPQDYAMRFWRFWQRKFYALKAAVAVVLGRVYEHSCWNDWHLDTVDQVAMWNYHETETDLGPGAEWEELRVGAGVFGRWWVGVNADGYP